MRTRMFTILMMIGIVMSGALSASAHDVSVGEAGHGDCSSQGVGSQPDYWLVQGTNGNNGCSGHDSGTRDVMEGNQGQDELRGLEGNDTIHGGAEGDDLAGGAGADYLQDDQSNDWDRLCDGDGHEQRVDVADGDGNDKIFMSDDGIDEMDVIHKNPGDEIQRFTPCPFL